MKRRLSKAIVFLLAVRPLINQLRGDTSLLELGDYNFSVLSMWSLAFMAITAVRLPYGPSAPRPIRRTIATFLLFVIVFGVPRMLVPEAFVTDVLEYAEFFIAALVARGVIEDVGIDYIIRSISWATLLLLVMHVSAPFWVDRSERTEFHQQSLELGSYLGAFESKHIAGVTFFAVTPFLMCGALRKRKSLATALLPFAILFLILALQRVSIVSLVLFMLGYIVFSRRFRLLLPIIMLGVALVAVVPQDRIQGFIDQKVEEDVDALHSGNLDDVGAGRASIIMLAETWFFDQSDPFDQFFGRGTAQAQMLHFIVVGNLAYAHLQFVELIIDYGIIGTGLVLLIFGLIARSKLRSHRQTSSTEELVGLSMFVAVAGMLVYAMPLQDGGTNAMFAFWMFPSLASSEIEAGSSERALNYRIQDFA